MKDLAVHLALFVFVSAVIVGLGTAFAEQDDRKALALLPRKLVTFFVGCGILIALMLIAEHTLASIH